MTAPLIAPFDSSAAWKTTQRLVSANSDVLLAIAGVFFLLPMLVWAVFIPPIDATPDMTQEQVAQVLEAYYTRNLPYLLPLSLLQMVGLITMLVGILDRTRPTVGEALRNCAVRVPAYLGAQLLTGAVAVGLLVVVAGVLMALRVPAPIAAVFGLAAMIWPMLRTIMVGPVLGVGKTRNPIMAIRASLALTKGNTARIMAFLGLAAIAFLIVSNLLTMLVGLLATLVLGKDAQAARLIAEAFSAVLYASGYTWFVVMLAAIHGELTKDLPRPFL